MSKNIAGIMNITHIPQTYIPRDQNPLAVYLNGITFSQLQGALSSYATHRTNLAVAPVQEIEIPFYSIYDFLLRPDAYSATLTPNGLRREPTYLDQGLIVVAYQAVDDGGDSTESYYMDILKSVGDDFNFFFLLAPPPVASFQNNPFYNPTWITPPSFIPASAQNDIKLIINEKQDHKPLTPFDLKYIPTFARRHSQHLRKLYVQDRRPRVRHTPRKHRITKAPIY